MPHQTRRLHSPEDTTEFASRLAPRLSDGDTILLEGALGSGKSHFARALIRARLGRHEDVPSPTYTLVQTYTAETVEIWHADLYRLGSEDDIIELGLDEAFEQAICLVEWPDRLGNLQPPNALTLQLLMTDETDSRDMRLEYTDPRWQALLRDV